MGHISDMTGVLMRKIGHKDRHIHREKTEIRAVHRVPANHQMVEKRPGTDSPSQPSAGTNPTYILILEDWPPEQRQMSVKPPSLWHRTPPLSTISLSVVFAPLSQHGEEANAPFSDVSSEGQ